VLFHYLANIYGWSWETFWYKTPIAVLKILPKYLNKLWGRGWLGHHEVMFLKALARSKGYKGFEDYGTGKVMRDPNDIEDPDAELDIEEEEDEIEEQEPAYAPLKDWGELKGTPAEDYQISE
jgi:hypothetical protein